MAGKTKLMTSGGLLYLATLIAQALNGKADNEDVASAIRTAEAYADTEIGKLAGILNGASVTLTEMAVGKVYLKDGRIYIPAGTIGSVTHILEIGEDGIIDHGISGGTHTRTPVTTTPDEMALKAPLESPSLTGTPTAPTASPGTSTTQLATTAFVTQAIASSIQGRFKFVATLPAEGEAGYIYLVPHNHAEPSAHTNPDLKDEFVWDSEHSQWELIGNTDIDLSGYWSKEELVAMTNEEILEIWNSVINT